jgi:integrase
VHESHPYWPENLLRRHTCPAAQRCGISKPIGWHTFRHSYATHLKANGEDVKVVQESLRHANSRTTLDIYTQALTPAKREAQTKVVIAVIDVFTKKGTRMNILKTFMLKR